MALWLAAGLVALPLWASPQASAVAAQDAEPVPQASAFKVDGGGLAWRSTDGEYEIRLRGLLQGDGRFYSGADDTFLWRTARPIIEGTLAGRVDFRLTPELAGSGTNIVDAYADLRLGGGHALRIGKFTSPVGLERLQSSSSLPMMERSTASELAPNRDIGLQLQGRLRWQQASYAFGVFYGSVDGRDVVASNPDDRYEWAGRLFLEPFRGQENAWSGLGFGIGASTGDTVGAGNDYLPRYRSAGQKQFFSYRADVAAAGRRTRISPQGYYYRDRFGLMAEYVVSRQRVGNSDARATLDNRAWEATASYVLTGEAASYKGVKPAWPVKPGTGNWGAFELVGRYGVLDVDDDAFPLYADPAVAAGEASTRLVGVNWYLTGNFKLVLNYLETRFEGAAANGDRADERAVFVRAQMAY
ncbi:OprO/OprP family phosphate-selective porin [Pseudoxanthomonas kalamensis]|uniref:OprO/OprP family phosphate-selective porin n=1 Tax=Pseudoxanthomonas kalamensis TaxID=289483 RepID=UPI0013912743|nr:porin [Pseudoxanthomonas kalamensis]